MPGFSPIAIVIVNRGHMLGRITSIMVRLILTGNKVVVNMSRNFFRNKLTFLDFLWKSCNVLPNRGPFDDSSFQDLLEDRQR